MGGHQIGVLAAKAEGQLDPRSTEDGGRIWLTAAEEEGEIVVRVWDNGIGIAAEMLPRVFALFTQVPASATARQHWPSARNGVP